MATAAERDGYRAASKNLGFRRGPVDSEREQGHRDEEEAEKDEEDRPLDGPRAARGGGGLGRLFHDIEYGRNAGRKQDAGEFVMILGRIREKANKNDGFRFELRKKRRLGRLGPRRMRRRLNREKGEKREGREKVFGVLVPRPAHAA